MRVCIFHTGRGKKLPKDRRLQSRSYILRIPAQKLCVQRVLQAHSLKASALYYKTKLEVHNYTIFDMASKDVECHLWNEVAGGLNSSEFASFLVSTLWSMQIPLTKLLSILMAAPISTEIGCWQPL